MSKIEGFDGEMGSDGVWRFSNERELPIQYNDEIELKLPDTNKLERAKMRGER